MQYADDIIYECSKCKKPVSTISVLSGNTFGSTLYSDGYLYTPMMDSAPSVTKCPFCKSFIWIKNLERVNEDKDVKVALRIDNMDLNGFREAIKIGAFTLDKEEKYLRIKAWWLFNDYLRNSDDQVAEMDNVEVELTIFNSNNLEKLKEQLSTDNVNEKIQLAEVYRNLGDFESCMKLINELPARLDWLVKKITVACEAHNPFVMKLR